MCFTEGNFRVVYTFTVHGIYISDWIYENMASVSVQGPYAKCVLGTKTLTLPTQDSG